MGYCKALEKCKAYRCCSQKNEGLATQIERIRPTERVIERQIVELARRCEDCGCVKEEQNA